MPAERNETMKRYRWIALLLAFVFVLAVLAGDYDIIAVIKPRSTPFLDAVRAVGGVELVGIDETDREALRRELVGRAEKELRI